LVQGSSREVDITNGEGGREAREARGTGGVLLSGVRGRYTHEACMARMRRITIDETYVPLMMTIAPLMNLSVHNSFLADWVSSYGGHRRRAHPRD